MAFVRVWIYLDAVDFEVYLFSALDGELGGRLGRAVLQVPRPAQPPVLHRHEFWPYEPVAGVGVSIGEKQ